MSLFPMFVKLQGKLVVIVGGGNVAESKIPGLLRAAARVRLIAPEVNAKISEWIRSGEVEWRPKVFAGGDLRGARLVIAATSAHSVNRAVYREADAQGIWCNAVDDIENCHFYSGSIVQRGDLQIAISTNGKSPALAQRLRKELEAQYGPEYEVWLEWLGAAREVLRATHDGAGASKDLLHYLASHGMYERFLRETHAKSSGEGVA
jgi:precorrin-2 dehydrogenase/sirohydrochlorin ferrochelatase